MHAVLRDVPPYMRFWLRVMAKNSFSTWLLAASRPEHGRFRKGRLANMTLLQERPRSTRPRNAGWSRSSPAEEQGAALYLTIPTTSRSGSTTWWTSFIHVLIAGRHGVLMEGPAGRAQTTTFMSLETYNQLSPCTAASCCSCPRPFGFGMANYLVPLQIGAPTWPSRGFNAFFPTGSSWAAASR